MTMTAHVRTINNQFQGPYQLQRAIDRVVRKSVLPHEVCLLIVELDLRKQSCDVQTVNPGSRAVGVR